MVSPDHERPVMCRRRQSQALLVMTASALGVLFTYFRPSGSEHRLFSLRDSDATKDTIINGTQRARITTPPALPLDPFVREILDDPVFHNGSGLGENSAAHRPPKELLRILDKIESRPWSFNRQAVEQIRRELEDSTHTRELLVLTQQNTPPNTSIRFAQSNYKTFYVPESLQKYQPEEMPFANARYNQCSIVGNSGILVNSGCGDRINQADFVIRFNFPPVLTRFMKDSGIRTHLFTCNAGIIDTK
ncbi:ST8SIA5 [Branchiostoma lanceolatum]|uniref:ST8SIA5 protein n=1 Tax=Branchiostoma lanceolatum TaxID=7740 RepID=A0A8J9W7I7_BRALA|nr:ST8SIA5 [Branchiostoma lanceolatum]